MTNLLHMMRKDGDMIRERIGRVVIMGGALDVPGNTTPVAECEFTFLRPTIISDSYTFCSQFLC